ncbi:universal stress protein [Actinoallomurus vinaceus]|uniref:Universal stress protein n=1 Tax=Actinoallomurus vinaceus TaxID=1080074 RepID=A0ABP8U4N4_9ACTN
MDAESAVKPVVVGVDGSECSLTAVDWAADEAELRRCPLRIVYVFAWPLLYTPLGAPLLSSQLDELMETARQVVHTAERRAQARVHEIGVESAVIDGGPIPVLLEESARASLVVVGSRGLGAVGALFLGSTGVELAARAACPVVAVRGREHKAQRVVVGVDGSDTSLMALWCGFEEADLRAAGLTAIHAVHRQMDEADGHITDAVNRLRERFPGVPAELTTVMAHPAEALINASADADLLVVGSRGRGGFRGLMLGSVSQAVLHNADCPVAVQRAGKAR